MKKIENAHCLFFIFVAFFAHSNAWSATGGGLENFHSVTTASAFLSGPGDGKVKADVYFQMPDHDMLSVTSPTSVAGRVLLFGAGKGLLYVPQKKLAISLSGLPKSTPEEFTAKYQADSKSLESHFSTKIVGIEVVAGIVGSRVEIAAKPGADTWIEKATVVVDSKYQQILMSDTVYRGGSHLKVESSSLTFNAKEGMPKFSFTVPTGTTSYNIDFDAGALAEQSAKSKPGFANYFPSPAPAGFKAVSYAEVAGAQGSYSVLYRKGADYIAVVALYKCDFAFDMGTKISVKKGRSGVLFRSEVTYVYAYQAGDYVMMVAGNAQLDDILNTAVKLK